MRIARAAFLAAIGVLTVAALAPPPEWPGFRGPGMDGLALGARLPERWSKTTNVKWAIDVPGRGWSSPVVAGNTVFVTSAISSRPFKQPTPGIYGNDFIAEMRAQGLSSAEINKRLRARDNEVPEESDEIRYMVYAFDAATGALKWEREAHKGLPFGGRHRKNTYASETPFTDGERVYVSFGLNIGLFAYTLERRPRLEAHVAAAADLSRLRHRDVARSSTTGASISCRTVRRSATSRRSTRRPAPTSGAWRARTKAGSARPPGRRRSSGRTRGAPKS